MMPTVSICLATASDSLLPKFRGSGRLPVYKTTVVEDVEKVSCPGSQLGGPGRVEGPPLASTEGQRKVGFDAPRDADRQVRLVGRQLSVLLMRNSYTTSPPAWGLSWGTNWSR